MPGEWFEEIEKLMLNCKLKWKGCRTTKQPCRKEQSWNYYTIWFQDLQFKKKKKTYNKAAVTKGVYGATLRKELWMSETEWRIQK